MSNVILHYLTIFVKIYAKGRESLNYTEKIYNYLTVNDIKIHHYSSINSTNIKLKEEAKNGALEGTVIIADSQFQGHGRFDRVFHSPKNGIYMSILLRPQFSGFNATLVTTAAAVAVAKAVEDLSGKETKIKWVNDVLISGKKICGILTEGAINPETLTPDYIVVGIGINAFKPQDGFDPEIQNIADAVFDTESEDLKARLIAETINNFMNYYTKLTDKVFLECYRSRSAVIGKEITVIKNTIHYPAKALEIDNDCRLLVEYPDKSKEYLSSGEISIKL